MAEREQIIQFTNSTPHNLIRFEETKDHGSWTTDRPDASDWGGGDVFHWFPGPPSKIEPGQNVAWGSQSSGVGTGTEARVKYKIDTIGDEVEVYWDVPFFGVSHSWAHVWVTDFQPSNEFFCDHIFTGEQPSSAFVAENYKGKATEYPVDGFELVVIGSSSGALTTAEKRVYDAVWQPGSTGEMQFYGMKWENYQKMYDQLWKRNWRLYLLNTYIESGKRLYDAVWRPGTSGEMQFYGLKYEDYQKEYDKLWKQNWRIYLLNTYIDGGKRLYDAVWRPGTSGEMQFYGLKYDDYQKEYDKLWKQNWRIYLLNTYIDGGKRLYDAVWRPGTSGEMQFYGLKYEDYQKEYDRLWKESWRIEILKTYHI